MRGAWKEIEKARWWVALVVVCVAAGCSTPDKPSEATTTARQALTSSNGIWQNGLSTNGIWQNGIWQNGIWQNGIWQNGIWQNGIWQNGIWQNGIWQNGIWQNGIWQNGIWQNGIWQNGLPGEMLRSSQYARQLLQYVYACALPAATASPDGGVPISYDTTLDPNNGTLACAPDATCDAGYTCSASHTCVVPLSGVIGVGVNADGSTWWGSGTCDLSCQRWVSACVLARTNAYGVHVNISMRAPDDAPQAIKDALKTTPTEVRTYAEREGAYYGNIFETAAVNPAPSSSYSGPAAGPIASTPAFFACAGPDSNLPEITKRFCSSQGDQVVIAVPGVCLSTATEAGTCAGQSTDPSSGAIQDCYTNTAQTGTEYKEVITVYLQQPIAVCGNGVCEPPAEDSANCSSDCHPGTWSKDFSPNIGQSVVNEDSTFGFEPGMSAVAPDGTIVVAGTTFPDIDLGGGTLPANGGAGVLAKYQSDGTYAWGVRFGPPPGANHGWALEGVTVASNGNITVLGWAFLNGSQLVQIWSDTYRADGTSAGSWGLITGPASSFSPTRAFAVDSQGNVVMTGVYSGNTTLGSTTLTGQGIYVAKVSPQPQDSQASVVWAEAVAGSFPLSLSLDSADNIVLLTSGSTGGAPGSYAPPVTGGSLVKLSGADGSTMWTKAGGPNAEYSVAAIDPSDNVYASGYFESGQDFGGGPLTSITGLPPFLEKYGGDGSFQWASHANIICPPGATSCGGSLAQPEASRQEVEGIGIGFDPAGDPVLASFGDPVIGGGIDFGVGIFPTYSSNNVFLAAYSPDPDPQQAGVGRLQWAKHVPMIVSSELLSMAVDGQDRVVMSGNFSGSMQVDGQLLVTAVPEQPNVINSFLASFAAPSIADTMAPAIGAGSDQSGVPLITPTHPQGSVPSNIVAEATSAAGAVVFFMPPTSIDKGNAGTSVACSPPPNTTFPIGTTPITCTASDPLGTHSSATFTVTVVDTLGPVFSQVPGPITTQVTGPGGAKVTFALPTAIDQVDGNRPVTCTPPSGSTFAGGTTIVTCTSSDTRGNTSSVTFPVYDQYEWSGFLPPINPDGSSVFKLGSTVPVKFQLNGASAGITNAVATLSLAKISSMVTGTYMEAVSTSAATTGNAFRYDPSSGQYIFNLSTKPLSAGSWQLSIDLHDGVSRTVTISLR